MSRKSPSGPFFTETAPFPGGEDFNAISTRYAPIDSIAETRQNEIEAQVFIAKPGQLKSLRVELISVGDVDDTDPITWNVNVNGENVPGLTVALSAAVVGGASAVPDEITELVDGDLLSLEVVTLDLNGPSPQVRTFVEIAER